MYKLIQKLKTKNTIYYVLSFFIPILIVLAHVFSQSIIHGDYIMKGENFLVGDATKQYISIYSYVWDILHAKASLFYSFGKGIGGNMMGTVGYYASSPLNLLYFFVSRNNIPIINFINYMLKIGFASLFMYMFLKNKFGKDNRLFIFAIIYALIAYNVNYHFHSMWLDVMAITPLVMVGINNIINKKSIVLYVVALSAAIVFNFYIAYMLCIFCVIYFIYELLIQYKIKEFKKYRGIILKFVIGSLIAGGLSAFWSLPIFYDMIGINHGASQAIKVNFQFHHLTNTIVKAVFGKLLLGSYSAKSIMEFTPSLYSGLLTIVLAFLYFFNGKISLKERILSILLIIFFCASFIAPELTLFWHAGSYPNCYVSRFSFVFSVYLIILAVRSLINIEYIKIRYLIACFFVYAIGIARVFSFYVSYITTELLIVNMVFITLYLIVLTLIIVLKKKHYQLLNVILILLVIVELFINFKCCFVTKKEWNMTGRYQDFSKNVCSEISNLDDSFYRVDGDYRFGFIDQLICGKSTISISLSTTKQHFYDFWKQNGGSETFLDIWHDTNLPILDSVLGVKYVINDASVKDSYTKDFYSLKKKIKFEDYNIANDKYYKVGLNVYENPYALSLGYLIPNNYQDIYNSAHATNTVESLNRLMKTLSGNDADVLVEYDKEILNKSKNKYKFNIDTDDKYIYFNDDYDIIQVILPEVPIEKLNINSKDTLMLRLSNLTSAKIKNKYKNKSLTIKMEKAPYANTKDGELIAYHFDQKQFEQDIQKMKEHQLYNAKISGNKITGMIDASENSVMFTSIPYEKGWRVYVDGKKVNYEKVIEEFVGFKVSKGTHKIEMKFYPPYMLTGIIISSISLCSLLLCVYVDKKRKKYLH